MVLAAWRSNWGGRGAGRHRNTTSISQTIDIRKKCVQVLHTWVWELICMHAINLPCVSIHQRFPQRRKAFELLVHKHDTQMFNWVWPLTTLVQCIGTPPLWIYYAGFSCQLTLCSLAVVPGVAWCTPRVCVIQIDPCTVTALVLCSTFIMDALKV